MAIDLFANSEKPDAELHPQYLTLRDSTGYSSARGLLKEMQTSFVDPDGNFVEQFQTAGFDSRTFELFLHAMFHESGHAIDRNKNRPDFLITRESLTVAVEAVTASAPSNNGIQPYFALPENHSPEDRKLYVQNNLPIRLGSPLFSKLKQQYWLEPHVAGRPFIIAIQDFHAPGSLTTSSSPLSRYLYGIEQDWYHNEDGKLVITENFVEFHESGSKKIPSGFFNQPEAENIAAVLFCNSGTLPKFARMGHEGGYRDRSIRMIRYGTSYQHDADAILPEGFVYEVGASQNGRESWREGTILIRNPNARFPLPAEWLGAGTEEDLIEGRQVSTFRESFLPYWSLTEILGKYPTHKTVRSRMDHAYSELAKNFPMI